MSFLSKRAGARRAIQANLLAGAAQALISFLTQPSNGAAASTMSVQALVPAGAVGAVTFQVRSQSGVNVGSPVSTTLTIEAAANSSGPANSSLAANNSDEIASATVARPAAGTGYVIIASAAGATAATSSTFNAT